MRDKCSSFPFFHSLCQDPDLPFLSSNNSICHAGKPTPGISPGNSLADEHIFQRAIHAVLEKFFVFFLMTKPVTPLVSTASCNLRLLVKSRSFVSPITA